MTNLPSHWQWTTIGNVCRTGSGGTPRVGVAEYYGGTIPWVVIGDLNDAVVHSTKSSITELGLRESSATLIPPGTLLMAMYGASIGKLGFSGAEMATNQAIVNFSPTSVVLKEYLYWFLMSQRRQLLGSGKGAAQKNMSQASVRDWPIPLPPLAEQERLVEMISDLWGRITGSREALKASLMKAKELRRRAVSFEFQHLVRRYGQDRAIGDFCETALGKMLDRGKAHRGRQTPYLRNADVQWRSINIRNLPRIDLTVHEMERYTVSYNDLLVCEGGEVGRCAIWKGSTGEVAFQKALHRVRASDSVLPEYLAYVLGWLSDSGQLAAVATGSTIKHLPQVQLRKLKLPLPPLAVQRAVVNRLEVSHQGIARLEAAVERAESSGVALATQLLSRAFVGELTDRLPDAQHASILLDRIGEERAPAPPHVRRRPAISKANR